MGKRKGKGRLRRPTEIEMSMAMSEAAGRSYVVWCASCVLKEIRWVEPGEDGVPYAFLHKYSANDMAATMHLWRVRT